MSFGTSLGISLINRGLSNSFMGENTSKAVHDTYGNIQYNLKQDNCNLCEVMASNSLWRLRFRSWFNTILIFGNSFHNLNKYNQNFTLTSFYSECPVHSLVFFIITFISRVTDRKQMLLPRRSKRVMSILQLMSLLWSMCQSVSKFEKVQIAVCTFL